MSFRVKHMMLSKIAIILSLCLVINNTFVIKSYADDALSMNPLFIPITTFVTASLIGSGIIAKNSEDAIKAGGQIVNDIISQIKSSEIAKTESDDSYDSPYRVINGGQPEKPNNDNKNGKWVAVAGGALASNEIYANKEAIKDIMQRANSLGAYNQTYQNGNGLIDITEFKNTANLSNVALQLANISNSALKQFNDALNSDLFINSGLDKDKCYYAVNVNLQDILRSDPYYPRLNISVYSFSDENPLYTIYQSNFYMSYGSYTFNGQTVNRFYSSESSARNLQFRNADNVVISCLGCNMPINYRSNLDTAIGINWNGNLREFSYYNQGTSGAFSSNETSFAGYKGLQVNPLQFTNNVYNLNLQFDENFQNWVQGQIQGLGGQIIDAVRLGLTSVNTSWQPTQEQIQEGTSPSSVIYQFINNYENPENIPDDEEEPDNPVVVPPAIEEPQPTNDYLGNFLLPESITTKFPFCIPFDVARCLQLFSVSEREAPKWECDLNYGSSTYHVVIDLAMFNDVANFIRPLEYILFLVGLAIGTRSLIRG